MSFSAPSPPDPYATANAQQGLNKQTAITQAYLNNVNQITPYGNLSYTQTGTSPDGTPQFTATTQLSPQEQALFDATMGTQNSVATDAGLLAKQIQGQLTHAPDLSNSALTQQMMNWGSQYLQPVFNNQQSNLNSQLAAQGITQGSDAWNNAQNLQSRNVNNAYENLFMQAEPLAYNQAVESYQLPISTLGTLLGEGQPGSVNQGLVSTPQEQIQPANLESLVQQNYQSQLQNYGNSMSGIFGIGSALAGGIGRMLPFSDRRLKEDVAVVGQLFDGTPVYRFRYITGGPAQIGVMAQDVILDKPEAVELHDNGYMMVDYQKATEKSAMIGRN